MDTVQGQARDEAHQKIQPLRESLEELIVLWGDRPNQDNDCTALQRRELCITDC
jgi:hypothetical protein